MDILIPPTPPTTGEQPAKSSDKPQETASSPVLIVNNSDKSRERLALGVAILILTLLLIIGFSLMFFNRKTDDTVVNDIPESKTEAPPTADIIVDTESSSPAHSGTSVPISTSTIVYDTNNDGRLDRVDISNVASAIDGADYFALIDFNSDNIINVKDLAMIRDAAKDYPLVYFDITGDAKVDMKDVSNTASLVDGNMYLALVDFDSDYIVGTKDLALIRAAVANDPLANYDINDDGKLDGRDISITASVIDNGQYFAVTDFNCDNTINVRDLELLRAAVSTHGTVSQ